MHIYPAKGATDETGATPSSAKDVNKANIPPAVMHIPLTMKGEHVRSSTSFRMSIHL